MDLCVIEGDGIGHEVIPAAVRVLETVVPDIQLHEAFAGLETLEDCGTPLPQETVDLAVRCGAVLFGAANSPSFPVEGYFSPIIALRQKLKTYANIRPTRYLPVATARTGVDMIVMRENTEDLYVARETIDEADETASAQKVVTRSATERISHLTYKLAQLSGRERVTIVHKANILPQSDGLFRRVALEVSTEYPDIETDELLVDTAAYWMVKEPTRFDMILTSNLYGDILSDMAAAWGGGLGMIPALNLGDDAAIAEPVHGSAPELVGRNIANPTATILSVAMLLRHHWKMPEEARRVEGAILRTLEDGYLTVDLNPDSALSTQEFTDHVVANLSAPAV